MSWPISASLRPVVANEKAMLPLQDFMLLAFCSLTYYLWSVSRQTQDYVDSSSESFSPAEGCMEKKQEETERPT